MKIVHGVKPLVLTGEEGETLELRYSNMGEPYREGADITLSLSNYRTLNSVFLETSELIQLRDKLNELLPPQPEAKP